MNQTHEVALAFDARDFLGESPIWSPHEKVLYWINCENPPRIARLDPTNGRTSTWPMPERIGAIALQGNGRLLVALARGIYDFEPATGNLSLRAQSDLPDNLVLHEGKCDRQGRFWIGTIDQVSARSGKPGHGMWLRLQRDKLLPVLHDVSVANGLAWSPDGTIMYRADSISRQIFAHAYDCGTGLPREGRLLAEISRDDGMPDGATVDAEGFYWLTLFMGQRLRRYRPEGEVEREIRLPISKPTMLAFAGPDLDTLYITTTAHGEPAGAPREPLLGGLFRMNTDFKGLAEPLFDEAA